MSKCVIGHAWKVFTSLICQWTDLINVTVGIHSAGSSEGIQIEYIAVFVAVLFPGALVAFNYEVLQALPRFSTLRIYCAGIWHNAAVSTDSNYLCANVFEITDIDVIFNLRLITFNFLCSVVQFVD